MAAGFIVLPDGRCFSRRWSAHDQVLRAVAEAVEATPLRDWLLARLPGPDDDEELGYGAWHRAADDTCIVRSIDLRQMTPENQALFCDAATRAAALPREDAWLAKWLADLADMVARAARGEPPVTHSDWGPVVTDPDDGRIGPGWPAP